LLFRGSVGIILEEEFLLGMDEFTDDLEEKDEIFRKKYLYGEEF